LYILSFEQILQSIKRW